MAKLTKTKRLKRAAFTEVDTNEPAIVKHTRRTMGPTAVRKQKVAIALNKARRAGARIPKRNAK